MSGQREPQLWFETLQVLTQFYLCLAFELPNSFPAEIECLADFFQSEFFAAEQAETVSNDMSFPIVQSDQRMSNQSDDFLDVDLVFLTLGLLVCYEDSESTIL